LSSGRERKERGRNGDALLVDGREERRGKRPRLSFDRETTGRSSDSKEGRNASASAEGGREGFSLMDRKTDLSQQKKKGDPASPGGQGKSGPHSLALARRRP